MEQLVTPKQVAAAIGVSESSLKRWCDKGLLRMQRTAGGHRRLPIAQVVQFLRQSGQEIVRPELLGLPSNVGRGETTYDRARSQMREALERGDEERCRRIVFDLYLSRHSALDICDRIVAPAFHDIGDRWQCGDVAIYEERRACELCLRTMYDLEMSLPAAPAGAPVAIGAAVEGDPYKLPTTMVEIILREAGWRAQSYGTMLPLASLGDAVQAHRPKLVWLSLSWSDAPRNFLADYAAFYARVAALGAAVAVGGQALTEDLRREMQYSVYCDNLRHLISFIATLVAQPAVGAT